MAPIAGAGATLEGTGWAHLSAFPGHLGDHQAVRYPSVTPARLNGMAGLPIIQTMLRSYCAIFVVAWSLWGLPTLCVGGVLEHLCADHDERCDEHEQSHEESGCPQTGECEHESDCGSDPCVGTVARFERCDDSVSALTLQPCVLADLFQETTPTASLARAAVDRPTRDFRLRIHPSDLPLLI